MKPPPALEIDAFLEAPGPILDVRSPAEYAQGRIPDAHNIPLFSNEERVQVGTCYKQQGPQQALMLGLELVGPKLASLAHQAHALAHEKIARVHCWRGGQRSQAVATMLANAGVKTVTLQGGYKAFRRHCLNTLERSLQLHVLGGMTGSGKTRILHALRERGEQTIDLEALANHRGSAFGGLGLSQQPSNEQFENSIASELMTMDLSAPIWIEDESRKIGRCKVPDSLYQAISSAPLFLVNRPKEERAQVIEAEYGHFRNNPAILAEITERLRKRLGSAQAQQALKLLQDGELEQFGYIMLDYYDRTYHHSLRRRQTQDIIPLNNGGLDDIEWAALLQNVATR